MYVKRVKKVHAIAYQGSSRAACFDGLVTLAQFSCDQANLREKP